MERNEHESADKEQEDEPKSPPTELQDPDTVEAPGWQAFGSWMVRAESRTDLEEDGQCTVGDFLGPSEPLLAKLRKRKGQAPPPGSGVAHETVSYEPLDTPVWHKRSLAISREKVRWTRWVSRMVVVAIGVIMSVVSLCVSYASESLLDVKISWALRQSAKGSQLGTGFAIFLGMNLLFAVCAFLPVAYRVNSAGSGIAEAKAVLNGVVIPQCTDLTTAACKAVSAIFAVAASLPVGLEGPLIFIGLCLGENASWFIPRKHALLRTDRARRDFAAVGTAAGVSNAFYAPVGGVLFAMEEGASFWSVLLMWKYFAAACVTLFVTYFWVVWLSSDFSEPIDFATVAKFSGLGRITDSLYPPFFVVFASVGIVVGLLGATFVNLNRKLALWRRQIVVGQVRKFAEVLFISVIMSILVWWLPSALSVCNDIASTAVEDKSAFRQYECPDGQYNELATLLLNDAGSVGINLLFHEAKDSFHTSTCVLAGCVYLVMLIFLFGSAIGMGIFVPLLFVGTCFGRAFETWAIAWGAEASASTMAIVGATAIAGVTRVLISIGDSSVLLCRPLYAGYHCC